MDSMKVFTKFSFPMIGLLLIICLAMTNCQSQTSNLAQNQIDSLKNYFQKKLSQVILKDKSLQSQIKVDSLGISIFAPNSKQAEFVLLWQELPQYQNFLQKAPLFAQQIYPSKPTKDMQIPDSLLQDSPKIQTNNPLPLQGFRIALDPGHFAEDMKTALMEGKYIKMDLADGTKIRFFESELAWFTSRILGDELEKLGAKVLMSRDDFRYTAFNETYMDWYKRFIQTQKDLGNTNNAKLTPQQAFFQHFRRLEFEQRAEKMNAFRPHLSLVIHYNVNATNTKWDKPTPQNNSMTFAGGAYMKGELDKTEARFHLLRFLLTQDLENSVDFGKTVLQSLEDSLNIKPISASNDQFFLKDYCLPSEAQGVYFRNLTLARKLLGTMTYLEPLYQDNAREVIRLNKRDFEYKGQKIPSRVYEVAQAYKVGILKYLSEEEMKD